MSFLESLSRAVGISQQNNNTGTPAPASQPASGAQADNPGRMNFQAPASPPNQNNQNNQNNNPGQQGNEGNNQNPGGGSNPPNQQPKPFDPLSIFAKIGDNSGQAEAPPAFTLDPAQLTQVANGQDFIRGVAPELLAKANSGDSQAMIEVMQVVSRNAYQAALMHNSKLTETFVSAREGHSAKGFGSKVRGELTVNALTGTPNFDNPAVRRHLVSVAQSLEREHPDASPDQIAEMARRAVTEMAQAINPNAGQTPGSANPKNKQPTDWDSWFDS